MLSALPALGLPRAKQLGFQECQVVVVQSNLYRTLTANVVPTLNVQGIFPDVLDVPWCKCKHLYVLLHKLAPHFTLSPGWVLQAVSKFC